MAPSKKEGAVLVYGSPPDVTWKSILPEFNKKYPWIKIEPVDIQGPDLVARVKSEQSSGSRSADLVVDFADTFNSLADDIKPKTSRIEDQLGATQRLAPGVYGIEASPLFTMYNKKLVDEDDVPTTWEEILAYAKKHPGKVGAYDITGPPSVPAIKSFAEQDSKAWDLLDQLAPLVRPEEGGGPLITKTSQGEYEVTYAVTGLVRGAAKDLHVDSLLGFKMQTDAVTVMPRGVGVLAKSKNPNAAGLLLDFLLSKDGQEILCTKAGLTSLDPATSGTCGDNSLPNLLKGVDENHIHYVEYTDKYLSDRQSIIDRWKSAQRK